jgi:hypothetical protein
MSQTLKLAKLRWKGGVIEVISSEIQPPEMAKKEEATVGMNGAIKPAASKVEANDMACCFVTLDPIPTTALLILHPRGCRWRRTFTHIIFTTAIRRKAIKRNKLIKLE